MEIQKGILEWNIEEIASALKISINDVEEYFTDGRRISLSSVFCRAEFNYQKVVD